MKNALQSPKKAPQPPQVVAVPSLTPTYGLLCLQPVDGYEAGVIRPVYGSYLKDDGKTNVFYSNGNVPKGMRLAVEEESYENEIILCLLPDYIQEVDLKQSPQYRLIIMPESCKLISMPNCAPKKVVKKECRVITHPATKAAASKPEAPKTGGKVLPLFPDYPTSNKATA